MRPRFIAGLLLAFGFVVLTGHGECCFAGSIKAFSLREANRLSKQEASNDETLRTLGGITRFAGMVFDRETSDVILVGKVRDDLPPATLDDLVVALRCRILKDQYPLVSIDMVEETKKTGLQKVRFGGDIQDTKFGQDFLNCDVILKRYSLHLLRQMEGVESYLKLYENDTKKEMQEQGQPVESVKWLSEEDSKKTIDAYLGKTPSESKKVQSRFWFYAMEKDSYIVNKDDVCVIEELRLGVEAETIPRGGAVASDKKTPQKKDEVGRTFASQFTEHYKVACSEHPALKRLKVLFDLVCIAEGVAELGDDRPALEYLMAKYHVDFVDTPEEYPLVHRVGEFHAKGDATTLVQLSGGGELDPGMLALQDGDASALKDIVLSKRPSPRALCWTLPLDEWEMPNDELESEGQEEEPALPWEANIDFDTPGFSIDVQMFRFDPARPGDPKQKFEGFSPLRAVPPPFVRPPRLNRWDYLRSARTRYSDDIGGVMLSGVAKISGSGEAKVDLTGGDFSLVVDGRNARIDPKTYRKFITALWAVYYCEQDPGISIDPIAPNVDKHLVRYIGRVVNTDLGRVMRETDYMMKTWAVGPEKPDIKGFPGDIDHLSADLGMRHFGPSRRFWFVPEKLRFERGGDLLLFASGRMRLKTEYDFPGVGRGEAGPADKKFAAFFTENYEEFAEKYPAYRELFEYAKMVSLAKYLKQQGVPLHWFLMANKDLVLTEDSPGTVDELAKDSETFEGITIMGGVDLGYAGQYVYNSETVQAIGKAISQAPGSHYQNTNLVAVDRIAKLAPRVRSFDFGKDTYSVLPQHTLTSGKDRRGIRYQTDLAVRHNGQPGLELVRYYSPGNHEGGQFGKGWHLMIPYRVKPADATTEFQDAVVPLRKVLRNVITGEEEVLTFSADRYALAGYVPEKLESSQVVGLFLISDTSYRLADKLGNQFHFDQAGYLTDTYFSPHPDHHLHVEYADHRVNAFEEPPYELIPVGREVFRHRGMIVLGKVKVTDRLHRQSEVFTFSGKQGIAAYVPENEKASHFQKMILLSDKSFRLLDKNGNEITLRGDGKFDAMLLPEHRRTVRSMSMGGRKVTFKYTIDDTGQVVISSASLAEEEGDAGPAWIVRYQYDGEGRLLHVKHAGRLSWSNESRTEHLTMDRRPLSGVNPGL